MTDINQSLAELAANAEERRAALEVENEALRVLLLGQAPNPFDAAVTELRLSAMEEKVRRLEAEKELLEQERDNAIWDVGRVEAERDAAQEELRRLAHRLAIARGERDRQ